MAKETLVIFHNGLNYNYHLTIKGLARNSEKDENIKSNYKTIWQDW